MKTLQIDERKARGLYKTASEEFKQTLEDTFGKTFFERKITDRVKSYKDACIETGEQAISPLEVAIMGLSKDEIAYRKLKTIAKALNEGVEFDIYDSSVTRHYPWFACNGSSSAFGFSIAAYDRSNACAGSGSRLAVKSKELAVYFGTQFLDIWRDFIG